MTRTLLPIALCGLATAAAAADRPNILLILTDDQGWPTLGCYGNRLVPTPNLDRLAAEGMRFTDAYVLPQCTPTRAALLTGQHSARNRMWHVIPWYGYPHAAVREPAFVENLPASGFNLAKGLRAAGYATACIGKWHLTHDADGDYSGLRAASAGKFGFDHAPPPAPKADFAEGGDRGVDRLTDDTLAFIEKNRSRPFFAYLAHHTLHGKVVAPERLVRKHLAAGRPAQGLHNATYLAAIEHLDDSVGRLMKRLDDLGLRDKTLVVFLSDNGGVHVQHDPAPFQKDPAPGESLPTRLTEKAREFDNAPLRAGKGSAYEGGIRVPMIVRWPGRVKPGSASGTPVHVVDLLPTLLEAAGGAAPADHPVDGVSLLPLLTGSGGPPERALFWHLPLYDVRWGLTPCAVIRRGDHKLIEHFGDRFDAEGRYVVGRHVELFDLRNDIGETRNLAAEQPELAARLLAELHAHIRSAGSEIPGANPDHDPRRSLRETKRRP